MLCHPHAHGPWTCRGNLLPPCLSPSLRQLSDFFPHPRKQLVSLYIGNIPQTLKNSRSSLFSFSFWLPTPFFIDVILDLKMTGKISSFRALFLWAGLPELFVRPLDPCDFLAHNPILHSCVCTSPHALGPQATVCCFLVAPGAEGTAALLGTIPTWGSLGSIHAWTWILTMVSWKVYRQMSEMKQSAIPAAWIYFPCRLTSLALLLFITLIKVVISSKYLLIF